LAVQSAVRRLTSAKRAARLSPYKVKAEVHLALAKRMRGGSCSQAGQGNEQVVPLVGKAKEDVRLARDKRKRETHLSNEYWEELRAVYDGCKSW